MPGAQCADPAEQHPMAISRSRKDVTRYVLLEDRNQPPELQSEFLLRPLSNAQMAAVQNLVTRGEDGSLKVSFGTQKLLVLKAALVGWERYVDEDGAPVKFEREKGARMVCGVEIDGPPTDATLERLAMPHWNEIAGQIIASNILTTEDVGN